ncbi:ABC transporter ATP-binding protein [Embleya sp. NPDC059259]|uniref:ABC transporter ATP-binding protein n=2 Tax=Embleya TaxID=2699295 RepID=UPI0036CA0776
MNTTPTGTPTPTPRHPTPRHAAHPTPHTPTPHTTTHTTPHAATAQALTKTYGQADTQVRALDNVSVGFRRGEFTAIMGPSGSGKSTLMHCMAGLDRISGGSVRLGDVELASLDDTALTHLRRDRLGFVFQAFNLLPTLTALENITLPLDIAGRRADPEWLDKVIETVGLGHRLDHRPAQLSGGQQQRVACARALVGRPEIIFADEPTGNLDSHSGTEVLEFLRASVTEAGQTIVMVTHDAVAASYADRVLFLADGRIVDDMPAPTTDRVLERMRAFNRKPTTPTATTSVPTTPATTPATTTPATTTPDPTTPTASSLPL